jgi:hypothetical protein
MILKQVMYLIVLNCVLTSSYAITADSAQKKCRQSLAAAACSADHPSIKEIETIKNLIIARLNKMESADVHTLPELLYDCMAGVDALNWVRDNSADLEASADSVSMAPYPDAVSMAPNPDSMSMAPTSENKS